MSYKYFPTAEENGDVGSFHVTYRRNILLHSWVRTSYTFQRVRSLLHFIA